MTLSKTLPPSTSAHAQLPQARPLAGTFDERLRLARETEMAMDEADAIRGRLAEGAVERQSIPAARGLRWGSTSNSRWLP